MSHSNICFKNLITLLVLLVLVYFHLPLRSNYYASQKKLYKWYWCSMAKYPELCQGICLPFMGQNCYRGIHKLMINSCLTPLSSLPPSPLFTHESVLSLVYLTFFHSQFTFYCLCEVTYHHSYNFIWPVLDSKEVKWSMNATWLKSPLFLVFCSDATIMLYTILHEFATVLLAQLLEQVIFYLTKHFAGQTWKSLDC